MQLGEIVTDALKDGKLINISKVESGLRCGCVCAGCGGQLIARKGDVKVHHFAHVNADCQAGQESAIHLAFKEAYLKHSKLIAPVFHNQVQLGSDIADVKIEISEYINDLGIGVVNEYSIGGIRADSAIVDEFGNPLIFIEFAFTHYIDKNKESKLKAINVPCFEVDINGANIGLLSNFDYFSSFVSQNSKWVVNEKAKEITHKEGLRILKERREQQRQEEAKKEKQKKKQIAFDYNLFMSQFDVIDTMIDKALGRVLQNNEGTVCKSCPHVKFKGQEMKFKDGCFQCVWLNRLYQTCSLSNDYIEQVGFIKQAIKAA